MPQVPIGRFLVLDAEIGDRILGLLLALPSINIPYAQIGPLCAALQTAPAITVQDGQDIGLVDVELAPPEPGKKVDAEVPVDPDQPDLHVVGGETDTGLPESLKDEAK